MSISASSWRKTRDCGHEPHKRYTAEFFKKASKGKPFDAKVHESGVRGSGLLTKGQRPIQRPSLPFQ